MPLGRNNQLSLLRLDRKKKKNSSNPFRIRIFLFLSYSFGFETINLFIHSLSPSKTITEFRPKWAKCIPVFRPKLRKNPARWNNTYLYRLYKGVPPGSHANKTHFHNKGFALSLVLKVRVFGTRKCPVEVGMDFQTLKFKCFEFKNFSISREPSNQCMFGRIR